MVRKLVLSLIAVLGAIALTSAQQRQVSGTVTGVDGQPIAGATILVEGTQSGTTTGADGKFTLRIPSKGNLLVSFLGYKTETVAIDSRKVFDVVLSEDATDVEDVVVVGYGSGQKVGNIVGSVTTVKASEIAERPSANIGDALQGKVSGLQIFSGSGEPQSSVKMQLRGPSSLNLDTAPLYILDGVPVSQSVFNSINPQDIETISTLKDASSTAIYGSRAANGVIYISTKKGKKGEKPSISLRAQYGVSMLTNYNMDMMNSEELIRFEEMCIPSLKTDAAYQAQKAFILGNNINFDWTDYLFDDAAPMMQFDASMRGATENTTYFASMSYYSEQGTSKANSSVDRVTFRVNLDTNITKWLKFGTNIGLNFSKYKTITTGWYTQSPILQAVTALPYRTPYEIIHNEDGTISYGDVQWVYPWDQMIDLNTYYKYNTNDRQNAGLMGQTYFEIRPVKGLTIRAQQAIDAFDYTNESINMPSYYPYTARGRNSQALQRGYQLSSTNTIEYKNNINAKHFFTVLLGHESITNTEKTFNARGTGLTDDRLVAFGTTTTIDSWDGNKIERVSNSFFANMNYNFDGRYFVDASVRTDGSSLFGRNHRYATFFSVGTMWKAKAEKFMQNVKWVNDLNVTLSYGTTGNSGLSNWYEHLGLVGAGPKYNGLAGWGLAQVPNSDLTWETVSTLNVGLNGRLFDRVGFNFQFYNKKSTDLLMELPFSATTGHASGMGNIGEMVNRGIDLEVNVDLIHTKNVYWSVSANVNYNKNKITKLYQGLDELAFPDYSLKYQVGKSSTLVYTQLFAGVDPADGTPMWYDLNGNKTKTYSDDLMQFNGWDTTAPWSGGFSTQFSWKGLGFSADFSWVGERWIFLNERYYTMNPTNLLFQSNFERKMFDMWTEPGQVTDVPKYGTPFQHDTRRFSNASFLRMKAISLSYTFPKSLVAKSGFLSGAKIYVTGRNLWTITDFEGYDPEVGVANATSGMYPNSRQIVFGAELTF